MRFHRRLLPLRMLLAVVVTACGLGSAPEEELASAELPISVPKSYPRKIYAHMMPWFQVGGQHWSMNSRNSATGVASWYSPMIGEYSSGDANVIEYQLLTMKYAGIDGILVDWPGLNGANDLPQNKANAEAIIDRTAAFGLQFGIVYEDQYAVSADAAKNDMAYVRDNFLSKANRVLVNGSPALLVFGPQKITNASDWSNILSVLPTNLMFFPLWYNDNAGSTADGRFAWIAQNALKGVADFDNGVDGVNQGWRIPVLYPGFNPYYAQGGWPGPTWKISYSLKTDNTEGGDTFRSTFELGKYAGDPLQIATWNDYGEGTMIEPTNQFQYRFVTTLQQAVGTIYTDAELKIVKMLYDQRRQFGASKQAQLDQASAALANLDVARACSILGCATPVHTGSGGATGSGGLTGAGGSAGPGGSIGSGGSTTGPGSSGSAGQNAGIGGATSAGSAGATFSAGGAGAAVGGSAAGNEDAAGSAIEGSCGCSVIRANRPRPSAWLMAFGALALASSRRRRRTGQ